MSHPKNPDRQGEKKPVRQGEHGFTLIEGLVALAVVSAALGALAELNAQSRSATLAAEHRSALAEAARMIEVGLPSRVQLGGGERSGVVDGYRWRLQTAALPSTAGTPWSPRRLSLQVRGPGGETLQIETIRLQPAAVASQ
ncbi:MAG TPA: prepilin-type N-terminal cleavage/methylation domain-containing protein [Roseiarcus sp.]